MNTLTATGRSASPTRRGDERTFWRVLLAVIAPLPMVAMGITYLIDTAAGNLGFRQTVAIHRERDLFLGLGPGWARSSWSASSRRPSRPPGSRARGAPRLATMGGVIAVGGLLSGVSILSGPPDLGRADSQAGLGRGQHRHARRGSGERAPLLTGGLLFLVGVVIGLGLLVAALGFVGVSWALLRMRNDDFDLAPRG